MTKVLFVEWCAKDALDGTLQMDPLAELAYRRIIDMIYASDDTLRDDDAMLQYATKTGAKWKAVKKKLVEDYKKISIENGYIKQSTCTEKLEKSRENIRQKSWAGKASAEARKSLKDIEPDPTAVPTPVITAVPTAVPTNQEPNTSLSKEEAAKLVFKGRVLRLNRKSWEAWKAEFALSEESMLSLCQKRDNFLQTLPAEDSRRKRWWMPTRKWFENEVSALRMQDEQQ